ncbi:uncharacterized protein LOC131619773 [Vicia villosa]|uniref:uncharacterized protein LOC131619773 n=1 Tax=Vicia villosa TaxID=3911 RepID=UPI00273A8A1D|nr:uncharacterized protein LOC131619773 [Vicia villosa]
MAENTRMKGLEAAINNINATMQKMMEDADTRHNTYMQACHTDAARLDQLEVQLSTLQLTSAFNEQFFDYYSTSDNHRLTIAAVHMEKDVVPWFQMMTRNNPFQSWASFTHALELEYGPSPYESPRPALFKLNQTTTVSDFYTIFTSLANRSHGLSPDAVLDYFISGLKPDIRRDVVAQNPLSLSKAFSLAKLFEEKYNPTKPNNQPSRPYSYTNPNTANRNTTPLIPTPSTRPNSHIHNPWPRPVRSITSAEIQLRRDKGLCFYFDETDNASLENDPPDQTEITPVTEDDTEHHLSFNALKGSHGAGTLRFQGQIQGIQIQVLLDSESSDNFLQPRIAHCLKIPIQDAPRFQVLVGNGSTLTTTGLIPDLPVTIQGHTLHLPVYLLPITGADLVLGAPWLKTLGPHVSDYDALSIKFYLNNKFITLIGYSSKELGQAQFHHIRRLHHTHSIDASYTLQFHSLSEHKADDVLDALPEDLAALLHSYWNVFDEPTGLPPPRVQDHSIPILSGRNPVKDSFPIPTVDELLDELFGASYFSKLDLRSGYHQILATPEDRHKTAFRTHQGLYEWLVMPFGLSNAPASFQSLMNSVFQEQLRKYVLVFFDDILVYSPTWSSHLEHLEVVLKLLQQHVLFAKFSKCCFGCTTVDYLGHTISSQGVEMDKSKIQAVMEWKIPTTLKQLRGFLGLSGYYRRFIKNYADIAAPLTSLLKKDAFQWTQETTKAFNSLKHAITQAPVLSLPDFTIPFTLETDASETGIGGVLSQARHPIAYFSKKMCPRMQKQSAYSINTPEQQHWLHKFLGYDFTIEYKPDEDNKAADSLSRSFCFAMSIPMPPLISLIHQAVNDDPHLADIRNQCLLGTCTAPHYHVKHDMLFWKNRLVIPQTPELIQLILKEFHSSPLGGQAGVTRTKARTATQFFWSTMTKDIKEFVS